MEHTLLADDHFRKFRTILETRIADLEHGMRQRDDIAVEQSPDAVEEIQRACERDVAISNIDRESKQLRNARAALRRIHEGSFGVCEDCDEEISPKRLHAIPWASKCVSCQEEHERRGAVRESCSFDERYAA
jgi:DnaK suppressor protein